MDLNRHPPAFIHRRITDIASTVTNQRPGDSAFRPQRPKPDSCKYLYREDPSAGLIKLLPVPQIKVEPAI